MSSPEQKLYPDDFSTDDIYLGEIAAQVAQHERAEFERAQRLLDEQEKFAERALRVPGADGWSD